MANHYEAKDFRKFLTQLPSLVLLVGPYDSKGRFERGKEFGKPETKKKGAAEIQTFKSDCLVLPNGVKYLTPLEDLR